MEELIQRISTGKAILFVGAGFSKSGKNINQDKELPLASGLAKIIGDIGNFDDGGDLKFAADYFLNMCCLKEPSLSNDLINRLKNIFTIKEAQDEHKSIMKVPWKRVYTTNYDDLVEFSAKNNGLRFDTVDIDDPTEMYSNEKICVHLNGTINRLDESTINTKFKLSQSSYLSSEAFTTSNWNYIFKKDLELSSAIVFVGYSLYDIEIEKILYENPSFSEKVVFIQREVDPKKKDTTREDYTFKKYGKLYRIGVSGFASIIEKNFSVISSATEEFYTEAFSRFEIDDAPVETIRERDIESFLRHGELSSEYLQEGMTSNQVIPYLIKRTKINKLMELIKENQFLCVCSELGNGKTYFLKEAELQLSLEGYVVYTLSDSSGNYCSDIDKLVSQGIKCVLTIDTYGNYKDLIAYLLSINLKNIKILLSERTSDHHSYFKKFDQKLKTKDLNIDILDNEEVEFLIKILEHTSLWGKYGGLAYASKKNHIQSVCQSQLSTVLIDVLKSTHIRNEVGKLISRAFEDDIMKMNIFVICLLDIMNIPITLSLVSDIARNELPLSRFSNSNEIRHFFTLNMHRSSVDTKSSIYSLYLLNEHFESKYVVTKCLLILKQLENGFIKKNLDQIRNDIRINLFRFNFIERILPAKTKRGMLVKYFEDIKNILPFHIDNPQYWLQYAMAHIALNNYDKAYRYLKTGYDKAKYRANYDVHKINNQKARLNLKVASLSSTNIDEAMRLFTEADDLLSKHENDVYKFKVVLLFYDFYESKKHTLSKLQRTRVKQACKHKLQDLYSLQKNDAFNFKQEIVYRDSEAYLSAIINSIS